MILFRDDILTDVVYPTTTYIARMPVDTRQQDSHVSGDVMLCFPHHEVGEECKVLGCFGSMCADFLCVCACICM